MLKVQVIVSGEGTNEVPYISEFIEVDAFNTETLIPIIFEHDLDSESTIFDIIEENERVIIMRARYGKWEVDDGSFMCVLLD